jgi:antitoxin component of MazEF toxin-antitoxin module
MLQVEIVKWGNSSAVRLPAAVLKEMHVALGDLLELDVTDGEIVLKPARREYRLENLLAGITNENSHTTMNTDTPVGREVW